jgi:anti-sigma B factor antagonist
MEDRLTVVTRSDGPRVILAFAGELDVTSAAGAEEAMLLACADVSDRMILDLTDLAFMDSTGVRVLVRARRRLAERGAAIELAGLTPSVSRIIHITGLDRAFVIHGTIEEALAAVTEPADGARP